MVRRRWLVALCLSAPILGVVYQQHQMASIATARAANAAAGSFAGRKALVVGATAGIGKGIALRLAQANMDMTIVGRDSARGREVLEAMQQAGRGKHDFVALDGSLLRNAYLFGRQFSGEHDRLDVLVLTQGIASMSGRTETDEGLDVKLALHWFGRAAFIDGLLPLLRRGRDPVVLSVLSAGVHGVYPHWHDDPELRDHFSIKNAADAAGLYNDVGLDALARDPPNGGISFVHAAPGFVASSWGTDLPWPVRAGVRALQLFGRSIEDCGEVLASPILQRGSSSPFGGGGLKLLGANAERVAATPAHEAAREHVWAHTQGLLHAARARAAAAAPAAATGGGAEPLI